MASKAIEYWEKSLNKKAETTKTEYRRYFDSFLSWASLSSEELYNLHKESLDAEDSRESDVVGDLVGKYMDLMRDGELNDYRGKPKKYSNATQNQLLKSVASFFSANKLDFPTKGLRRKRISTGTYRASHEDIRANYDYAMGNAWTTTRNRALLFFLKDSGWRLSDASNLNVGQYNDARDVMIDGFGFKVFDPIKTQKTGHYAYMVLGPESISMIEKYLKMRPDFPNTEDDIGEEVDPLFRDDEGKRWSRTAMSVHFIRVKKYVHDNRRISAHSLRKFHTTMLEGAGVPIEWVKLLQGKLAYVYSKPQEGPELAEKYAKAYDSLRILEYSEVTKEQVKNMQRVNTALQERLAKIEDERDELKQIDEQRALEMQQEVKTMIDDMKQEFAHLIAKNTKAFEKTQ